MFEKDVDEKEKTRQMLNNFDEYLKTFDSSQMSDLGKKFLPYWEDKIEQHKSRIDLIYGVVLGLILGVFENLAAQYSFTVFEKTWLWEFDLLFCGGALSF
jgi:hypothetical protein